MRPPFLLVQVSPGRARKLSQWQSSFYRRGAIARTSRIVYGRNGKFITVRTCARQPLLWLRGCARRRRHSAKLPSEGRAYRVTSQAEGRTPEVATFPNSALSDVCRQNAIDNARAGARAGANGAQFTTTSITLDASASPSACTQEMRSAFRAIQKSFNWRARRFSVNCVKVSTRDTMSSSIL